MSTTETQVGDDLSQGETDFKDVREALSGPVKAKRSDWDNHIKLEGKRGRQYFTSLIHDLSEREYNGHRRPKDQFSKTIHLDKLMIPVHKTPLSAYRKCREEVKNLSNGIQSAVTTAYDEARQNPGKESLREIRDSFFREYCNLPDPRNLDVKDVRAIDQHSFVVELEEEDYNLELEAITY